MRALLVVWLLLSGSALADWELLIQTDPPGATVLRNNMPLGKSGEPIPLSKKSVSGGDLKLTLELWGHEPAQLEIDSQYFASGSGTIAYPDPPQVLKARNPAVWAYYHPWVSVPGTAVLLSLLAWTLSERHRRRTGQSRLDRMDELRARVRTPHDLLGTVLGDYVLLDLLGQGGMAQVFRAVPRDSLDEDEAVAVKVMHGGYDGEEQRSRFIREGRVSKDLIHPNIVRLFRLDVEDNLVYLVLELVKGQTLRDLARSQTVSFDRSCRLMLGVMDAVAYAHGRGLVHRDLKPGNVMVTTEGQVKVMDFGLARRREVDTTITSTGCVLGTPGYLAPEQASGLLDPRSDQFAVGVMLFELLTGRRPFEGEDVMQIIFQTMSEDVPDPRQYCPEVPEAVSRVVVRMTRRDPEGRFPTVQEARDALAEAIK